MIHSKRKQLPQAEFYLYIFDLPSIFSSRTKKLPTYFIHFVIHNVLCRSHPLKGEPHLHQSMTKSPT